MTETEQMLASQVTDILAAEKDLVVLETELMQNEQFRHFLTRQKEIKQEIDDFWHKVETEMIRHDIKNIKGDWGTLTIAERISWETTKDLPTKFYKKVVDTKKISDTFRLEGKEPKGARHAITKYLTKKLK